MKINFSCDDGYLKAKDRLINLKREVSDCVVKNGISNCLCKWQKSIDLARRDAYAAARTDQDRRFVQFNYYAAKAYIQLGSQQPHAALKDLCVAVRWFINYLDNSRVVPEWAAGAFGYYESVARHIDESSIELFGNTPSALSDDVLSKLEEVVSNPAKWDDAREFANRFCVNMLFMLTVRSSEIYTQHHIDLSKKIQSILRNVASDVSLDSVISSTEFVLEKKKFHYLVRTLVPKSGVLVTQATIKSEICESIVLMKKLSERGRKQHRKAPKTESAAFKGLMAELDVLTAGYYEELWVKQSLIGAFKKLEEIFSEIRQNWGLVKSPHMFSHYAQEFVLLSNYYKLLLLRQDFQRFGESVASKQWQSDLADGVEKELGALVDKYFKYGAELQSNRKLMIVEESASGKFLEFVVYFLLREFLIKKVALAGRVKNISNENVKGFLAVISCLEGHESVLWNKKYPGIESDVDIYIVGHNGEKYGLFLKTGKLGASDMRNIKKEIDMAKKLGFNSIFQAIDIGKNIDVVRAMGEDARVCFLDVGNLLKELLSIAYAEKKIEFALGRSNVLTWAGFYSD